MRHIGNLMASTRAGRAKREGCQSADATHRRIQTGCDHHPAAGGHVHGVRGLGAHGTDLAGRQPHRCGRPERRRSDQSAHVLHKHSDESGDAVHDDRDDHDVVGLRAASSKCSPNSVTCRPPNAGHRRQGWVHRLQRRRLQLSGSQAVRKRDPTARKRGAEPGPAPAARHRTGGTTRCIPG